MTGEPSRFKADSLGDVFNLQHTWASILEPHGWTLVRGDGDEPRSQWQAPSGDGYQIGEVRTMRLTVCPHTGPLSSTEQGGVSKFRAYSILNHYSDDAAAAKAIITSNAGSFTVTLTQGPSDETSTQ